ncbi:hypothetical protein N7462_006440 [Penicillium macrosclerotiorum]|uniref:uncharacterized protein n=1 Tax=Penicillium macrosclerotiorum TaxID=303699 RepID=UPI0025498A85|nr:uncharacterized protein N7462_006440 [Penicillium macrosclerotiorum]KAJ5683275.1 hypothetical protein N7462_006440 [Penicillium macrosclerotiorum]
MDPRAAAHWNVRDFFFHQVFQCRGYVDTLLRQQGHPPAIDVLIHPPTPRRTSPGLTSIPTLDSYARPNAARSMRRGYYLLCATPSR